MVRGAHQFVTDQDRLLGLPVGDAALFVEWASLLARGQDLTGDVYYQAPLYPYLAAGVLALGGGLAGLRVVAALLGALSCVLLARGAAHFVGRRAGLLSGYLLALYPPALHYEALFEKTGLGVFLVCVLLALLARMRERPHLVTGLALGAVLGLLAMARENMLVLWPLVAWIGLRRGARGGLLSAMVLGTALALAPLALRNLGATGHLRPVAANFGPNLFIGNHAGADGLYRPLVAGRGHPGAERVDAERLAREALGPEVDAARVSAYWTGQVLEWWRAHPVDGALLTLRKFALLLHPREWMDSTSYLVHRERSWVLGVPGTLLGFGPLLALALVGALGPRRRRTRPLLILVGVGLASIALFFVFGRFRMVVVPILLPVTALGILDLWQGPRRFLLAMACAASVLGGSLLLDADALERPWVDTFNNIGSAHELQGRPDEARAAYQRALDGDGKDANAHFNLGRLAARQGDLETAAKHFAEAVVSEPSFLAEAHLAMAQARLEGGDLGGGLELLGLASRAAPRWAQPHVERGRALRAMGRGGEARAAYERALELEPNHSGALNNLGFLLEAGGEEAAAMALYGRALGQDPGLIAARVNLVRLLVSASNDSLHDGARALELLGDPGIETDLRAELGALALGRVGSFEQAADLAREGAVVARASGRSAAAERLDRFARSLAGGVVPDLE